ncbi:MAG: cobalamin-dependent protein [Candidatus Promineifilaceae bacterium]|nr:cobalamin-dependent protein [Candidatus Promineifilaceae bacterium]
MAKILFCHPLFLHKNPDEQAASSPYFPLGLLYLAGYVRAAGHQVAMFDATFAEDESEFEQALVKERPQVVGISALLPTRKTALELAQIAHERGVVVIIGGPDATKSPEVYLEHPQVDIVVHHEGEQTITAILDRVDRDQLEIDLLESELGVAFRAGGRLVVNEPRLPIENLDELPLPARDLIDMDRYLHVWKEINGYSSITISTTRGCPYGCDWCREAVHGNGYRQRSPESVAAEVKLLKETYQIDRLRVVDDVDGISREWLEEWESSAKSIDGIVPFEGLNELTRQDIPMLDVRDSL